MPATHGSSTNLSLNSEQNAFVQAAAADCSTGVQSTLLVWGPPGTGKTTSLAHSIVAILRGPCEGGAEGDTCVLAATPSNASADVLCSALARLGVSKTEMLRFNAQTRNVLEIPEVLVPFCNELEQIPADFDLANARKVQADVWQRRLALTSKRQTLLSCAAFELSYARVQQART